MKLQVDTELKAMLREARITSREMAFFFEREFRRDIMELFECYAYGAPWPEGVRELIVDWVQGRYRPEVWAPSPEALERLRVEAGYSDRLEDPWEPHLNIGQAFKVLHALQGHEKEWFYEIYDHGCAGMLVKLTRDESEDPEDELETTVSAAPHWYNKEIDSGEAWGQPIECVAICQAALKALDVEAECTASSENSGRSGSASR